MGATGGWITGTAVGGGITHYAEGSFAVGIVTSIEIAGHEHAELKVELKGWLVEEWRTVAAWQTIAEGAEGAVRTIGSAVGGDGRPAAKERDAHGGRIFKVPVSLGLCDGVRVSVRHSFADTDLWLGCLALRVWARGRRAKRAGEKETAVGWGALLDVAVHGIDQL